MKKSTLFCMLITISGIVNAQSEAVPSTKKLKLKSAGIELGIMNDVYAKMDLETMYDLSKNTALLDRDLSQHQGSFYRKSEGSRLGIHAAFASTRKTRESFVTNHEVSVGAFYSSREPLISYHKDNADGSSNTIIYCNMVNEFSANGAYLIKKSPIRAQWFSFYGGIGLSVGSSVKNQIVIMESSYDPSATEFDPATNVDSYFEGKSSLFSRIYVPLGLDFTVANRFQFGTEVHVGAGMQNVYNGNTYFMPFSVAVSNKFAWVF